MTLRDRLADIADVISSDDAAVGPWQSELLQHPVRVAGLSGVVSVAVSLIVAVAAGLAVGWRLVPPALPLLATGHQVLINSRAALALLTLAVMLSAGAAGVVFVLMYRVSSRLLLAIRRR